MLIHVVKSGESLYTIGQLYGVPYMQIAKDNDLPDPNHLVIGQTLVILGGRIRHTVIPGQSLYIIAGIYGISVQDIINANPQIINPALIHPGQIITIPILTKKLGTIEVNGYSFPHINMETLRKTLPHLTYLSIFSHEVRPDGSLSVINDMPLIELASRANVAPLLVITNIKEGGSFNSDLAHTILTDNQVQERLINNIIRMLEEKNYYGLDIDFEYVYPSDRENYNNFLRKVVNRLKPLGYSVTTAIAPKISADQPGLLYEGHDYVAHGEIVDHIIIMTYEWGYTYGPPMAVSPLNQVKRVLDYAVTVIPREKIFMGIPNYGYDWTLPYVSGTAARSLSNVAAVDLARDVGANIQFDTKAQSPFFNYYDSSGNQHVVWFEDARSIDAKLRLVNQYRLGGISYWTIGVYFPQNWLVLSSLYNIRKVI